MLKQFIIVIATAVALQGCGGGSTKTSSSKISTSASSSLQTTTSTPASTDASSIGLSSISSSFSSVSNASTSSSSYSPALPGDANAPALDAITNIAPTPAAAEDIEDGIIMTKFDVWLAPDATVGQINTAFANINAKIMSATSGRAAMTIMFPRVMDMTALQQKKNTLQTSAGIFFTRFAEIANLNSLPPEPANKKENVGHLFATRFPAAWNLSQLILKDGACIVPKVDLVILDFFSLTPAPGFYDEMPDFKFLAPPAAEENHGYLVSATAAAQFDAGPTTGANPFSQCLNVKGIDISRYSELEAIDLAAANFPQGKFILNQSIGLRVPCRVDCFPELFGPKTEGSFLLLHQLLVAIEWRRAMGPRDADFLATASAGNDLDAQAALIYPLFSAAFFNNQFAMGASTQVFGSPSLQLLQDASLFTPDAEKYAEYPAIGLTEEEIKSVNSIMKGFPGGTPTPAPNVLVVGGVNLSGKIESDFSNKGPDVHSVAQDIIVLKENLEGTSFAAPQVAGLASYLWLLSPELRALPASVTREAIIKNTRVTGDVRLVDAYASVLSLDDVGPVTPASRPMRFALLDVDANGVFNAADVEQFSVALLDTTGEPTDAQQQWDRYDLNGDGYTRGARTSRFDLDRTGSTRFGSAVYNTNTGQTIGGKNIVFSEIAVTDLDVLCYYAYSPLYTGDTSLRDARLLARCADTFGPATVAPRAGQSVVSDKTVFSVATLPYPDSAPGILAVTYDLTLDEWAPAKLIAPMSSTTFSYPFMVTSKKIRNDVLLVWSDTANQKVSRFDRAQAKWLDPVTLPHGNYGNSGVVMSDNGDACAYWFQAQSGTSKLTVWASIAPHGAQTWSAPMLVSSEPFYNGNFVPVAVADSHGRFHVIWNKILPTGQQGERSLVSASYDGVWHEEQTITPYAIGYFQTYQLGVDAASGDVYAAWDNGGVHTSIRDAGTGQWSTPHAFVEYCGACGPQLVVGDTGDALVTWRNNASHYIKSSNTWLATTFIGDPDTTFGSVPLMDANGAGRVIWAGYVTPPTPENRNPQVNIFSRRFMADGGWGPIETIVDGNNPGFNAPPIMTPNGTTFITWYEGGGKYFSKRFK
jgi:hypothetical protein